MKRFIAIVIVAILALTAFTVWTMWRRGKPINIADDVVTPLGFPIAALPWVVHFSPVPEVVLEALGIGIMFFGCWRSFRRARALTVRAADDKQG